MRERIQWIDVAKFLGIFAIYLGHFGKSAGNIYEYVFGYHVALFFFISGCMDFYDNETNIVRFFVKKIKRIMIPFWSFSILSILVYVVLNNKGLGDVKYMLLLVAKGNIRSTFIAGALWFLSCLFMMELIFKAIKYLKNKWVILAVCLMMFIIAEKVITPRPISEPHWLYNLDSVFYFIIFFGLGYIIYPYISELFQLDTQLKKIIFAVSGSGCFIYSASIFFGKDCIKLVFDKIPIVSIFNPILSALIIIFFNLIIAKLLEKIKLFNEIGKNTLYLCGNEYIVKILLEEGRPSENSKVNFKSGG